MWISMKWQRDCFFFIIYITNIIEICFELLDMNFNYLKQILKIFDPDGWSLFWAVWSNMKWYICHLNNENQWRCHFIEMFYVQIVYRPLERCYFNCVCASSHEARLTSITLETWEMWKGVEGPVLNLETKLFVTKDGAEWEEWSGRSGVWRHSDVSVTREQNVEGEDSGNEQENEPINKIKKSIYRCLMDLLLFFWSLSLIFIRITGDVMKSEY